MFPVCTRKTGAPPILYSVAVLGILLGACSVKGEEPVPASPAPAQPSAAVTPTETAETQAQASPTPKPTTPSPTTQPSSPDATAAPTLTRTPFPQPSPTPGADADRGPRPTPTVTVPPAPTAKPEAPPSPGPTPTPVPLTAPDVRIECVYFDGVVSRQEPDEYVKIVNSGTATQELEGWRLVDMSDGAPSFEFPAWLLKPAASVRVYTNQVHEESGGFSFQRGTAVWNNSRPDTAALYDESGRLVSTTSYPPGCE